MMNDTLTVSFVITKSQLQEIEELQDRLERGRSWVLRDLIRRGLEALRVDVTPAAPDMDPADRAVVEALARRIE